MSAVTIGGIVEALRDAAGPPRTVGALASVLGVTIDAAALAAGGCGILEVVVATPDALVTRLRALYGWSPFGGGRVTTIEDLRERSVDEWIATVAHGAEDVELALRDRYGAPREVGSHKVYDTCFVTTRGVGGLQLAFYAKLPDWAVPQPDPSVRARVLRELAAAVSALTPADAPWNTHAVARVLDTLPVSSGLKHDVAQRTKTAFSIELVPGIASTELVQILGWQNAVGKCRSMHLTDWEIWQAVGRNELGGTIVSRPALGPWAVVAQLDRCPTGGNIDAGARLSPLGGTHALTPADLVRFVHISLGVAPGGPPVQTAPQQLHTCAACGQSTFLTAPSPVRSVVDEERSGLDGRPSYGGDAASDAATMARELCLVTCPSCGHVAPSIATPSRYMAEASAAREELFASTMHCEDARRYLYIAQLHREDDVREQGLWSLRAAWANEAAGLVDVARRVRRRAGVALADAVRGGRGLEDVLGPSNLVLAEIFRVAGDVALAADHCRRGLEAATLARSEAETALLLGEGACILEGHTDPLTRAGAMERARALDAAQRTRVIEGLARVAGGGGLRA
jgi:hypothetical protein